MFPMTLVIEVTYWHLKYLFKKKRLQFSLTKDPMRVKPSEGYPLYSFKDFSTKVILNFPYGSHHSSSKLLTDILNVQV